MFSSWAELDLSLVSKHLVLRGSTLSCFAQAYIVSLGYTAVPKTSVTPTSLFQTNICIRSRIACLQIGHELRDVLHSVQEPWPHWNTSLMWLSMQIGQVIRSSIWRYLFWSSSIIFRVSEASWLGMPSTSVLSEKQFTKQNQYLQFGSLLFFLALEVAGLNVERYLENL